MNIGFLNAQCLNIIVPTDTLLNNINQNTNVSLLNDNNNYNRNSSVENRTENSINNSSTNNTIDYDNSRNLGK